MAETWLGNLAQAADAAAVVLAGQPQTVDLWYGVIANEPRLRVVARALSADDLRAKLAVNPQALILDPMITQGPNDLVALLTSINVPLVYVIFPAAVPEDDVQQVQSAVGNREGVRFYRDTVNLVELTRTVLADVQALKTKGDWGSPIVAGVGGRQVLPVRLVGVWSLAGGVGKTTVASNLACAAARRGVPSLLVGLGAPDDLPLILGLKPTPNITVWRANPSQEGLRSAIQKRDTVDVLAGFPDLLTAAQAMGSAPDAPNSLRALADNAIRLGYAAVIFDLPPSIQAVSALNSLNMLILIARPSVEGVMRAVEAYRTVVERLALENLLHPSNVRVVLNRVGSRLGPNRWHELANRYLQRNNKHLQYPPVAAAVPDRPEIGQAQDRGEWPYLVSEPLARVMDEMAADLFGGQGNASRPPEAARRVRIRLPF